MADDEAKKIRDELSHTSYSWRRYEQRDLPEIADFDTYKDELEHRIYQHIQYQALTSDEQRWALYLSESTFYGWSSLIFHQENRDFPTNKPNKHKAMIIKMCDELLPLEAKLRGYLLNDNKLAPQIMAFVKEKISAERAEWNAETGFHEREDIQQTIRELEVKDEELFPEPEPIRVEVAGAVINFTTWEAALVVYTDCSHRGKEVKASYTDKDWSFEHKAQVIERSAGGRTICAAIFTRIPLVTDKLRNLQKVVKRVDCTVSLSNLQETVTLFKGNVTELDWRGRK